MYLLLVLKTYLRQVFKQKWQPLQEVCSNENNATELGLEHKEHPNFLKRQYSAVVKLQTLHLSSATHSENFEQVLSVPHVLLVRM